MSNAESTVRIVSIKDMAPEPRKSGDDYAFDRYEISTGIGKRSVARVYWVPPGKANYPYHWHEQHEEAFFIISGEGMMETPGGMKPLKPGDAIFCPAGAGGAHKIINTAQNEPLVYFEVDAVAFPDVAHYPRTGAFGFLFEEKARNQFYKDGVRIQYAQVDEP